jgi:hypothetical protein
MLLSEWARRGFAAVTALAAIVCIVPKAALASSGEMTCGTVVAFQVESFSFGGGTGSGESTDKVFGGASKHDVTLTVAKRQDSSDATLQKWMTDNANHDCKLKVAAASTGGAGESMASQFKSGEIVLTNVSVTKIDANGTGAGSANATHQVVFRVGSVTEPKSSSTPLPKVTPKGWNQLINKPTTAPM